MILRLDAEPDRKVWDSAIAMGLLRKAKGDAVVAKVLQSVASAAFLVRCRDGTHKLFHLTFQVPLQFMDANTGETIRACVDAA